jgi:16S rRNA (uracil1498-N3)-methyltransferase
MAEPAREASMAEIRRPGARLFVEAALGPAVALELGPDQAHYVRDVMRLGEGAEVALFNGRDGEWRARIARIGRGWAELVVGAMTRPQAPEPDLWLVFAPVKRLRLDILVEKATELGVAALTPVMTRRTAVARVNVARLAAHAREAAEQCRRLTVPACQEPIALRRLLAHWPAGRRLLVCDEVGGGRPIAEVLAAASGEAGAPWAIMTGPEGGFDEAELEALRSLAGACAVGLGPRVLRADTAAVAALACWQAVLGDWSLTPPQT